MFEILKAAYKNDPASRGLEPVLYPGVHALFIHKYLVHPLKRFGFGFVARAISQFARFLTGIEIHPSVKIGRGVFFDHGIGIVLGETTELGDNCILFHNVTLGGTGKIEGKRHPTVGNNVLIGANATILGPCVIGDNCKIGAESVLVDRNIPPNCTVVGAPGRIVKQDGKRVNRVPDKIVAALIVRDYEEKKEREKASKKSQTKEKRRKN